MTTETLLTKKAQQRTQPLDRNGYIKSSDIPDNAQSLGLTRAEEPNERHRTLSIDQIVDLCESTRRAGT